MKNILIDANIFLEYFLGQRKADKCQEFFESLKEKGNNYFVSSVSVDTIVFIMFKEKVSFEIVDRFLNDLGSGPINLYQPNISDRRKSVIFMNEYGLDYEDALVLQSALSSNCDKILSFDKHFDKVKVVKRVEP